MCESEAKAIPELEPGNGCIDTGRTLQYRQLNCVHWWLASYQAEEVPMGTDNWVHDFARNLFHPSSCDFASLKQLFVHILYRTKAILLPPFDNVSCI